MEYCKRCVYPANTQPTIEFDDNGVCSGCRWEEHKHKIDWEDREARLEEILEEYKRIADERNNEYDCIVGVSGGKDSHYIVYTLVEKYDMNPLLVTYNHGYNSAVGLRNLRNLVRQFNCDLIRCTSKPDTVREISRYMLQEDGDITWPYHAGLTAFPMQIAIKYDIPLQIFGEGQTPPEELHLDDLDALPEVSAKTIENRLHGHEAEEMLDDPDVDVSREDLSPYIVPPEKELEAVGYRGIYLGSYLKWDKLEQTQLLVEEYDFEVEPNKRERTFNQYEHIDDHANAVHDYLKFLKYGYGRATDHAHHEVAAGRMSREEAIDLVEQWDPKRPDSLDFYLDFLGITEEEFMDAIEPMRDDRIWEKQGGVWQRTDSVGNHKDDRGVDDVRLDLVPPENRTFGENNNGYYYSEDFEPKRPDNPFATPRDDSTFTTL